MWQQISQNQINFQIAQTADAILRKTLHKGSSFFNSSVGYRTFKEDLDKLQRKPKQVTNLIVQLSVYGQFHQSQRVKQFQDYLTDALNYLQNLSYLKISLGGVDLNVCNNLMHIICKFVLINFKANKKKLKTFQFLTSNLTNCKLQQFSQVIQLGIQLGSDIDNDGNSFQNLTLQFNNWSFLVTKQAPIIDKKSLKRFQPNLNQLRSVLQKFSENKGFFKYKKFRLQISTWYYSPVQFILFLNQNRYPQKKQDIQDEQFLKNIIKKTNPQNVLKLLLTFVDACYESMKDIQIFELDFRNWHSGFKLKQSKAKFEQITNSNAVSMSIMSKRIGKNEKSQQQSKMEGKTFQKKFVF